MWRNLVIPLGFCLTAMMAVAQESGAFDDFDPSIDLPQWSAFGGTVGSTVLATNYGGSVSSPNSLWFGNSGSRFATTRTLNTTFGGTLSFWLRFGNGSNPWEMADLPGEGVVVEYSTNGGTNWTEFGRYDTTNFYSWTYVLRAIPVAAQGPATWFRWRQLANTGTGYGHWALDDVMISIVPNDELAVAPADGLVSSGYQGGPFGPSKGYTLSNTRRSVLAWAAGCPSNWVTVAPPGGTLGQTQATNVTVSINANADALGVGAYSTTVVFSNAVSGVTQTRAVTLTVQGEIFFASNAFAVGEAGGLAVITVRRAGNTNRAVTVDFATSNGTATAGSDYVATNGTLGFAAGDTVMDFAVRILDDTRQDGDEFMILTLSNPTDGGGLGTPHVATLTILDDEAPSYVGGTILSNTAWFAAASPYIVTGSLTVAQAVTLTIEAGVRVEFGNSVDLRVMGSLQAIGSEAQPILFTNAVGATSGGLSFFGSSPAALCTGVLSHCVFVNLAGDPVLFSGYADLRIEHCTFRDHPNKVIWPHDSRLWIVGNTISNTAEAINAVRCVGLIASNRIMKINGYADAIDLDLVWTGGGDTTMLLLRNELSDASDSGADGIDFGTSPGVADGNIIRNFGDKGISIGEVSPALVRNNLIIGCNIGIAIKDGSAPDLQNNTVIGCVYGIKSYPKDSVNGGRGSMTNSIVWDCTTNIALLGNSTLSVGFCDIQSDDWPGPGNISQDPQFVNPSFVNPSAGDYRLLPSSPCIDSGTNQTWMDEATDVDGRPRIIHGRVDMGVYEAILPDWDSNTNNLPDWWEWQYSQSLTNMVPTADDDRDGAVNLDEYLGGTDPVRKESVLAVTGLRRDEAAWRIDWQGGTSVWQYLQRRSDLLSTGDEWSTIFTNPPPTPLSTTVIDDGVTNPMIFYRIKAVRP